MTEFKYIILKVKNNKGEEKEIPYIFTKDNVHKAMSEYMQMMMHRKPKVVDVKCVSAGFIYLDTLSCHGESESLQLKSREIDSDIIRNYRYTWAFLEN